MAENDKNTSIAYILAQGLEPAPTARARIREMLNGLGLRFIFWDMAYSFIFAGITLAGALLISLFGHEAQSHTMAVTLSPLLFLLITLFAETAERMDGLYELKQTFYYTTAQVTALRAMCYSALGLVFTVVMAAVNATGMAQFWSLLPLCLCVFFLCAALHITILCRLRQKWTTAVVSAVWVFVNIALPFAFDHKWEKLLRGLPTAIVLAVAVLCAAGLVWHIRKLLLEGKCYASA